MAKGSILNVLYAVDDQNRIILSPNSPINLSATNLNVNNSGVETRLDAINALVTSIGNRLPSALVSDRLKVELASGSLADSTAAHQLTQISILNAIEAKLPVLVSGRIPVDGSAVVQPVSVSSLPLPTGASTAARQDTQTGLLQELRDNIGLVSINPTANTVQDRLRSISTGITSLGTNLATQTTLAAIDSKLANPLAVNASQAGVWTVNTNTHPVTQSGAWTVGISGTPTVNSVQSGLWNVGVTGTVSSTQSGLWNVGITGTPNVNAAQSGTWSVGINNTPAVTQSGTWNVGLTGTPNINFAQYNGVNVGAANPVHITPGTGSQFSVTPGAATNWQVTPGAGWFSTSASTPITVRLSDGTSFYSASGGGSITGTNFNSAFPTSGLAAGFNNGTNMVPARTFDLDTHVTNVENVLGVSLRLQGSGGSVALGDQTNPLRVDPTGTTIQPVSGIVTSNAGTGWFNTNASTPITVRLTDGTSFYSANSGGNLNLSTFGSAFPTGGIATGFTDGTNLRPGRAFDLDTGAGTDFIPAFHLRSSANGGSVEIGTITNPLIVNTAGTTTQPVSGTVTSNAGTGWFNTVSTSAITTRLSNGTSYLDMGNGAVGSSTLRVAIGDLDKDLGAIGANTLRVALGNRYENSSTPISVRISDGTNFAWTVLNLVETTLSAPGTTPSRGVDGKTRYTIQAVVTSLPITDTLILRIEGSLDGSNWFNLDLNGIDRMINQDGVYGFTFEGVLSSIRCNYVSRSGSAGSVQFTIRSV